MGKRTGASDGAPADCVLTIEQRAIRCGFRPGSTGARRTPTPPTSHLLSHTALPTQSPGRDMHRLASNCLTDRRMPTVDFWHHSVNQPMADSPTPTPHLAPKAAWASVTPHRHIPM